MINLVYGIFFVFGVDTSNPTFLSFNKKGENTMNKSLFLVVLLMTVVLNSYSMEEAKYTYDPKGLLIFLDDSEKDYIGAVSSGLITALNQNAGPIIVSASLLTNIFPRYEIFSEAGTPLELFNRYQKVNEEATKGNTAAKKELKYIVLKILAFDSRKWLFKKINDALYLLIPHEYLQKMNVDLDAVKKYDPDPTKISGTELRLGLKINHMETTDIPEIVNTPIQKYEYADYFIKTLYDNGTKTSSIFCIRSDYKNKRVTLPAWSIFIEGHGNMQKTIVHLKLKKFRRKFLEFLENKINTRLLMYRSCYAAGINNVLMYRDAKSAIERTYSFAIITQALTDATVEETANLIFDSTSHLTLKLYDNFANFLKAVTSSLVMDYQKITETIFPLLPHKALGGWGNVPQIKLPGVEWFSVLASKKDIISIGSIFAKTRDPQQSLDVVRYFKTDPRAILLYATDIPFELVINSNNLEAIISMVPGDAIHIIKKISSKKTLPEIVHWFRKIQDLDPQKIFFIREVDDVQNIMIINEKISLGLVGGILTVAHFKLTFLTKNNALYLLADNGELIAEVNPTFRKFYEDRLQLVRKQQLIEPPSGIENIKKVIAEKIKKGPQEFKSQELELKKALEKLQAALRKLHYALVHSA